MILGVPEDMFWYADYSFLLGIVQNKAAYDGWHNYVIEKEMERNRK